MSYDKIHNNWCLYRCCRCSFNEHDEKEISLRKDRLNLFRLLFVFLLIVGCNSEKLPEYSTEVSEVEKVKTKSPAVENQMDSTLSLIYGEIGLVDIHEVDPRIKTDLRYATNDNFMKMKLYDSISKVYLQKAVALRLLKVQDFLDSLRPGYRLLIFDGVRPLQVQQEMWDALDSIPPSRRGKFVSNPKRGSVHNFGAAVDVTILDDKGSQLDMGAGYDDFREIAFPSLEKRFLKSGELTSKQYNNRKLLRRVMRAQGFSNIPSEWWHFNAYSRSRVFAKYPQLLTESGASRWIKTNIEKVELIISPIPVSDSVDIEYPKDPMDDPDYIGTPCEFMNGECIRHNHKKASL